MLERLLACEHKPEACAAHSFVMGPAVVNNNKTSLEGLRGVEGLRGGLPSKGRRRKVYSKQHNIYIAMDEVDARRRRRRDRREFPHPRSLVLCAIRTLASAKERSRSLVPSHGRFVTESGLDMDLTKV